MGARALTQGDQLGHLPVEPLGIGASQVVSKRELCSREREQRPAFGGVEPQRAGERVENLRRGADVAPLLEPRVPGHADPRQAGELLAPLARRPAVAGPALGRLGEVHDVEVWQQRSAPSPEELVRVFRLGGSERNARIACIRFQRYV